MLLTDCVDYQCLIPPVTRRSVKRRDASATAKKRGRGGVTAFTDQYYSRRITVVQPSPQLSHSQRRHRGVTDKLNMFNFFPRPLRGLFSHRAVRGARRGHVV